MDELPFIRISSNCPLTCSMTEPQRLYSFCLFPSAQAFCMSGAFSVFRSHLKSLITREGLPDHLIQIIPHPSVSLSHYPVLFCSQHFSLSTAIVSIHLLVYYVFSGILSACRAVSATHLYSVIIEFRVFWINDHSPESSVTWLSSGSSLLWNVGIIPLCSWQMGSSALNCWDIGETNRWELGFLLFL